MLKLPESAVNTTLNLSTCHIPKHTADALTAALETKSGDLWDNTSYVAWHDYGWIMYVSEDQAEGARTAGHSELASILDFAVARRFDYLKLDADATELGPEYGLPTFDW